LEYIKDEYNTEDGQIRWLDANGYDLHLWQFRTIIPEKLKKKMRSWSKMNLTLQVAKKIRQELEDIKDEYNTQDGQIRWLQDNNYAMHLWQFRSVLPKDTKKKMSKWTKMDIPFELAKQILILNNRLGVYHIEVTLAWKN
jgi:DNA/RNA-binding domain of Phe-tRNA-synthetase-like protein